MKSIGKLFLQPYFHLSLTRMLNSNFKIRFYLSKPNLYFISLSKANILKTSVLRILVDRTKEACLVLDVFP